MNIAAPINLMLVEDERVVAFDLKNQLQAFGYRVGATVASGEQAVQRVAEVAPDLVLMDIHLEGAMDGVEAATEIQARHQIPAIYLPAFAEDDTLRRALDSRPFGYLVKPWDARELHASIQMALARRKAEVAVENSELRLKLAMDAASLGILEWHPQANRLQGDGHLSALFGDHQVPLDESWESFLARVDAEDRPLVVATLDHTLSCGDAAHIEFRTARDNGGPHFLQAHVKAYPGQNTQHRVVGVLQDVTEMREAEEERCGEGAAGLASRRAAIAMAGGGGMLVAPAITPIEQASTLYVVKILMSVAGFIVFCFGAGLYLYALVRERTEATVRLRRGSDGSSRRLRVREGPT